MDSRRKASTRSATNRPWFDIEKASLILLTDYRSGVLGRISLETPETRAAMLAEASPRSC